MSRGSHLVSSLEHRHKSGTKTRYPRRIFIIGIRSMQRSSPSESTWGSMKAFIVVGCLFISLTACSGWESQLDFAGPKQVGFTPMIASDANQNSPFEVELVMVHHSGRWEKIKAISAEEWFREGKTNLLAKHIGFYSVMKWEWIPGQKVAPIILNAKQPVVGMLVFVDYLGESDFKLQFDYVSEIRLSFLHRTVIKTQT